MHVADNGKLEGKCALLGCYNSQEETIDISPVREGVCQEHVTCYRRGQHADRHRRVPRGGPGRHVACGHEQEPYGGRGTHQASAAVRIGRAVVRGGARRGAGFGRAAVDAGMDAGAARPDRRRGARVLGRDGGGRGAVPDGLSGTARNRCRPHCGCGGREGALRRAGGGGGLRNGHEHRGDRPGRELRRRRHRAGRGNLGCGPVLPRHAPGRHRADRPAPGGASSRSWATRRRWWPRVAWRRAWPSFRPPSRMSTPN